MDNELIKILYIDDEKAALFNFKQLFQDDFEVFTAMSAAKGMEVLETTDIQIIVSDQRMPDKTGIEFFAEVSQLYPNTVRILLTAYSEASDIIDAINRGQIYQYITKPFESINVKNILDKASIQWRLRKENEILIAQLQEKNEEYETINEELKQTNNELLLANKISEESRDQIKEILRTAMDGFWLVDLNGNIIEVNEVACKMLGYTREELLLLNISDLEVVESTDQTQNHLQQVVENGDDRFESKHRCKNGEIIDVELSVKIQPAQKLIVVFVRDITEQVQNKNRIADLIERLSLSQAVSNAGTYDWDIQNNTFYWSDEFLKLFGMDPGTVAGFEAWTKSLHPDDIEQASINIQKAIAEKTDLLQHYRIVLPDGSLRWIRATGKITYHNDVAIRMIGLCIDVTDQKQAEENLRSSDVKFRAVAGLSPVAIYASTGSDQKGIYINETFYKIFGFTLEDVPTVGVWWIKAFPDEKYRQWVKDRWSFNIVQAEKNNTDVEALECSCTCKDGSEKIISWVGKTIGEEFWAFGYDFTERKQAEQKVLESQAELKKALELSNQSRYTLLSVLEDQQIAQQKVNELNEALERRVKERTAQLEAVNKELETFTYSVSHDLKAPLRGIDGFSKLLQDIYGPVLNEEAQSFLKTIRNSTMLMNQLIDDLLNYSRLERSQINIGSIDIANVFDAVLAVNKAELDANQFTVEMDCEGIELMADSQALTIAIRNLIENAIKFTKNRPNPRIKIAVADKAQSWVISVADNGIGFNMKYHQRIFEIFQRLERAEDFPGTGIGLAMVSKAMQRMKGKVWAESVVGEGSVFYLEIPKHQYHGNG